MSHKSMFEDLNVLAEIGARLREVENENLAHYRKPPPEEPKPGTVRPRFSSGLFFQGERVHEYVLGEPCWVLDRLRMVAYPCIPAKWVWQAQGIWRDEHGEFVTPVLPEAHAKEGLSIGANYRPVRRQP